MAATPVTVLNGFLGAGKTTLLKSLLQQAVQGNPPFRLAVIANDMSDLDVDQNVIASSDLIGEKQGNFISIATGSIASRRLLPEFRVAVARLLAEYRPSHLLVETSGSTHPWPLIEALRDMPDVELHGFLTLVDSVTLDRDHARGVAIVEGLRCNLAAGRRGIENLLAEQMMFANRIVLTKMDRLPDGALQQIGRAIHPLNPYADIVGASWGGLRLHDVLRMPAYDHQRVARLAEELSSGGGEDAAVDLAEPGSYSIGFRVLNDPRPFHPRRLWEVYSQFLGAGIHRSKGFFWLPTRDELVLLWNQTAGSVGLEMLGYWKIVALRDPDLKMNREERAALEAKLASYSPVFGDRRCELTVIGQEQELDIFIDALQGCFCTEEEVRAWQQGAAFDDPWPKSTARIRMG